MIGSYGFNFNFNFVYQLSDSVICWNVLYCIDVYCLTEL